ncbi:VirB6/TrbL-like conjugal transfer protein, CD1112 family [Veillonella absiana]
MFFKWIFKTFVAVLILTNTFNIIMGIFDMSQHVVSNAAGVIITDTNIDITTVIANMEESLKEMELGPLLGLWLQSTLIGFTMTALSICIFVIIYGRMIEIYLMTSMAAIPLATMVNREWGSMGQNYLRAMLALGFQAFLIMVCVGIYAVLVQSISTDGDIIKAVWTCVGYTVLLCFTLFKTSSMAKSLFNAH